MTTVCVVDDGHATTDAARDGLYIQCNLDTLALFRRNSRMVCVAALRTTVGQGHGMDSKKTHTMYVGELGCWVPTRWGLTRVIRHLCVARRQRRRHTFKKAQSEMNNFCVYDNMTQRESIANTTLTRLNVVFEKQY